MCAIYSFCLVCRLTPEGKITFTIKFYPCFFFFFFHLHSKVGQNLPLLTCGRVMTFSFFTLLWLLTKYCSQKHLFPKIEYPLMKDVWATFARSWLITYETEFISIYFLVHSFLVAVCYKRHSGFKWGAFLIKCVWVDGNARDGTLDDKCF